MVFANLAEDMLDKKRFDSTFPFLFRDKIINSEKFVLDKDAIHLVMHAAIASPQELAELVTIARLPYENVFIEMSLTNKLKSAYRLGTLKDNYVRYPDQVRTGILCSRVNKDDPTKWMAYYVQHGEDFDPTKPKKPIVFQWPVYNLIDTEGSLDFELNNEDKDILGYTYQPSDRVKILSPFITTLMDSRYVQLKSDKTLNSRIFSTSAKELSGNPRFAILFFALLNSPVFENIKEITKQRVIINGTPRKRFDVNVPKIHLGIKNRYVIKYLKNEIRSARKIREKLHRSKHEVRGFWRINWRTGVRDVWVREHTRGTGDLTRRIHDVTR